MHINSFEPQLDSAFSQILYEIFKNLLCTLNLFKFEILMKLIEIIKNKTKDYKFR